MRNLNTDQYGTFNDVQDKRLRTWNRCSVAFNIGSDKSIDAMRGYLAQFDKESLSDIKSMFSEIRTNGYNVTRTNVIRGNNATPKQYEAV